MSNRSESNHSLSLLNMQSTPYQFPIGKIDIHLLDNPPKDPHTGREKEPIVLVACGSFSPITHLHLRMFEMAKDRIMESQRFYAVGGYFSPVSDKYNKNGLAPWYHRVSMCEIATEASDWVMVDSWEARQTTFQRTVLVMEHFKKNLNEYFGDRKIRVMMLAGGDLVESFGVPNLWADEDLEIILGQFGLLIVERTGVDLKGFLLSHDVAYKHRSNIMIAKQYIHNDISSTKIRLFVKRGMSIKYLLPDEVIDYIYKHHLFENERVKPEIIP